MKKIVIMSKISEGFEGHLENDPSIQADGESEVSVLLQISDKFPHDIELEVKYAKPIPPSGSLLPED